jgi:hypothetical protein
MRADSLSLLLSRRTQCSIGRRPVLRSSYKKLHEIAGIIYRPNCQALFIISSCLKVNLWITKCALTSFIALQIRSESNTLQNGETSVYFSRKCSSTPVGFGQGFLTKNNVTTLDHLPYSPDLSPTAVICSLHWDQHCNDSAIMILLTSIRMRGRAEKVLTKWLPGLFSTPLQLLEEVCICRSEIFWRKYTLNDCNILFFSEKIWFHEHFQATT